MAYPYDQYGEIKPSVYDRLLEINAEVLGEGFIDWTEQRERFFMQAREEFPDLEDRDLWDTWRDYYEAVAG